MSGYLLGSWNNCAFAIYRGLENKCYLSMPRMNSHHAICPGLEISVICHDLEQIAITLIVQARGISVICPDLEQIAITLILQDRGISVICSDE